MKLDSLIKLSCAVVSSTSLAAVIIGLGGTSASAQITIQSTSILSGTIQLPSINPNFNQSITRIDTDDTGTYSQNLGTKNNPNYVPISLKVGNSPLARITIKVPANATLITPTLVGGSTPAPAPIVNGGSEFTVIPIVNDGSEFTVTPIVNSGSAIASPTPTSTNFPSGAGLR